jgi:hypothetical protein
MVLTRPTFRPLAYPTSAFTLKIIGLDCTGWVALSGLRAERAGKGDSTIYMSMRSMYMAVLIQKSSLKLTCPRFWDEERAGPLASTCL